MHEGLNSETCMETWKEEMGGQRGLNFSFSDLLIYFTCVPDFGLDLLCELS